MELTQEYLKQCLDYNSDTGVFVWKARPIEHFKNTHGMNIFNSQKIGKDTNCKSFTGYLVIRINKSIYKSHRLAWLYVHGYMPENDIDHINGVRNDNRICNLREATRGENMQNLKKARSNNKSTGVLGVYFDKKRGNYQSAIKLNYKRISLGRFATVEDAHNAYLNAKRKIHLFGTL